MVWKSTKKVGFGITGSYAVARFCGDEDIDPDDADEINMNVISTYGECDPTQGKGADGICVQCADYESGSQA